jgi:hypothetical protein
LTTRLVNNKKLNKKYLLSNNNNILNQIGGGTLFKKRKVQAPVEDKNSVNTLFREQRHKAGGKYADLVRDTSFSNGKPTEQMKKILRLFNKQKDTIKIAEDKISGFFLPETRKIEFYVILI